jgi:FAD:protein FMN transferase
MGTVASLHLRCDACPEEAMDAAFAHLHDVERRFSWYRADSEICRLDRGELREADASPDVREVLRACEALRQQTDGVFDVRSHRPDGSLDPSGYVKGWAAEGAVAILRAAGARDFCLNVGGDVHAEGEPEPGRGWRVGIRHPDRPDAVVAILEVRDTAVATSGLYERGGHVRDPRTGSVPGGLASVTIVGSSLAQVDAYATIALAMGADGTRWAARQPGCEVYAISDDGSASWTPGLDSVLVAPAFGAPAFGALAFGALA